MGQINVTQITEGQGQLFAELLEEKSDLKEESIGQNLKAF